MTAVSVNEELHDLLSGRRWAVLSGAGISTDSGIPDYRGPDARPASPMMYGDFVAHPESQKRYWARSMLGWMSFGVAQPNDGHLALARLAEHGLGTIITQNVDGLHQAAGSPSVLDLHGRIDRVLCLDCGTLSARSELQERLVSANPRVRGALPPGQAELESVKLRPDGDAVVDDWADFVVVPCAACGGVLKPDVVFFGESVPSTRVAEAYRAVDAAEALVVAGSSLTVMSGLRFVRHAARTGVPVAIINRGPTRGDELATVRVDAGCSPTLTGLLASLIGAPVSL